MELPLSRAIHGPTWSSRSRRAVTVPGPSGPRPAYQVAGGSGSPTESMNHQAE